MPGDLRHAVRRLRNQPGYAAAAILALALGIGCNTAIFSVIQAVLLRTLPMPHPERLVGLWEDQPQIPDASMSAPDFRDLRAEARSFESMSAYVGLSFRLTGLDRPERAIGSETDSAFFEALQAAPLLGALYRPGSSGEVVLSERLWRRVFGADPGIVGRTLTVNGEPKTVVGVLPQRSAVPARHELWVSAAGEMPVFPGAKDIVTMRGSHYLRGIARLRPGVSVAQAQAELDGISARLAVEYPPTNKDHRARVAALQDRIVGQVRTPLLVLLGGVVLVLLIACANVASLQLARAASGARDVAIRVALGASRGQIVRQLLVEALVVALAGGALGLAASFWGVRALVALAGPSLPRGSEVSVDVAVLAFTLAISSVAGMAAGLVPALLASRAESVAALRTTAPAVGQRSRLRSALVTGEVALAVMLLVGAALLVRSFARLRAIDAGFRPEGAMVLPLSRPEKGAADFYAELVRRVSAMPGVRAAGAVRNLPMTGSNVNGDITLEGRPARPGEFITESQIVAGDYFAAMGIPLRRGRSLEAQDTAQTARVAVVNEAFARLFFPGEEVVGKRFGDGAGGPDSPRWARIVGVVGDVRQFDLTSAGKPEVYYAISQVPSVGMTLVVRSDLPLASIAPSLRSEIASLDPEQPVTGIERLEDRLSATLDQRRLSMLLLSIFSAGALLLAVLGIYATLAYSVAQRTREIGVRMALGARAEGVVRLVVGQGMRLALLGAALGVAGALLLGQVISGMLFGVGAHDPGTFAAVVAVLLGTALLACWVPAWRAARVDPLIALRAE